MLPEGEALMSVFLLCLPVATVALWVCVHGLYKMEQHYGVKRERVRRRIYRNNKEGFD